MFNSSIRKVSCCSTIQTASLLQNKICISSTMFKFGQSFGQFTRNLDHCLHFVTKCSTVSISSPQRHVATCSTPRFEKLVSAQPFRQHHSYRIKSASAQQCLNLGNLLASSPEILTIVCISWLNAPLFLFLHHNDRLQHVQLLDSKS
ncbi:hypothetical protein AVEN_33461-1 [Araneus ventricosus]|uniref:Uncharacterized protein n=1 Tax=Araneus ventricosus TaxID=182803 RepID=A0A4Y2MRP3_ARAVE|nr:hypothetical protein AVEN_33461-1 [Araneus ventricosus]